MNHGFKKDTVLTIEQLQTVINPQHVIFAVNNFPIHEVLDVFRQEERAVVSLLGSWKGEAEAAFLCEYDCISFLEEAGYFDDQECVMLLGPLKGTGRRDAVFAYGKTQQLIYAGELAQVSAEDALLSDGFTYDPTRKIYFGIE
jgi:hypothetical protein